MSDEFVGSPSIKITIKNAGGYDSTWMVIEGTPKQVAEIIAAKDSKASTLMLQANQLQRFWQEDTEKQSPKGSALAGKPGQPPESMAAPAWAGDAPRCNHDKPMRYKRLIKKDSTTGHLWECIGAVYPSPDQCEAKWINEPTMKKVN